MTKEDSYYIDEDGYHEDSETVEEIDTEVAWFIFKNILIIFGILLLVVPWIIGIGVIISLIF